MLVKDNIVSKKEIKRKRILDAAADLFSRKSYHEVMMEDVAHVVAGKEQKIRFCDALFDFLKRH